jgi:hypothetical protein
MRKIFVACLALFLLAACSSDNKNTSNSESKPAAKPAAPKEAQYDTGRTAFQRMYISARQWAADAKPFRLQSQYTEGAPVGEGKAGLWRGSFASPARRSIKLFVWSGLVGPDAPEPGITFSAEDAYNPANSSTRIFDIAFLKIDSDQAYEVAQKHGGDKIIKKNPKQPVFLVLDWDGQKNQLVWHVIYGNSNDESALRVAVNATTGEFIRVEK